MRATELWAFLIFVSSVQALHGIYCEFSMRIKFAIKCEHCIDWLIIILTQYNLLLQYSCTLLLDIIQDADRLQVALSIFIYVNWCFIWINRHETHFDLYTCTCTIEYIPMKNALHFLSTSCVQAIYIVRKSALDS